MMDPTESAQPGPAWTPPSLRARPCGARTRAGPPCRGPAVRGRRRCRMHGGAPGAGAPRGNRNRLMHGAYAAAAKAERRRVRAMIRAAAQTLRDAEI